MHIEVAHIDDNRPPKSHICCLISPVREPVHHHPLSSVRFALSLQFLRLLRRTKHVRYRSARVYSVGLRCGRSVSRYLDSVDASGGTGRCGSEAWQTRRPGTRQVHARDVTVQQLVESTTAMRQVKEVNRLELIMSDSAHAHRIEQQVIPANAAVRPHPFLAILSSPSISHV
jgi:hypothetical protein